MARTLALVLGIAAVLFSPGCQSKARNRQINPTVQSDLAVNANQVRLRMRSLVDPFAGEIEQAADKIGASASSPSIKRAAIRWKIEGVPAIRGALFQPDPFVAVLDTWAFTFQMEDFFESGPGRMALGAGAPVAVETSRRLEQETMKVTATFTKSGDVSKVREYARQWATEHPIRYALQDRETTLSRVVETDVGVSWSIGEAVADLTVTADDVHREIQIYSDHLFRQARWEAELLMVDLPATGKEVLTLADRAVKSSESAVVTLDRLAPAIESAAGAATNIPVLITSERKEAVDAIHQNLTQTLTFLQNERLETLKQISDERIAALAQLTEERIAALKEIRLIVAEERIEALKELHAMATEERVALSQEIEKTGFKLVDHAGWWTTRVVAAALVFVFLAVLFFIFLIRKLFFPSHEPRGWVPGDVHSRV
jgi:hypothetical protein